MKRIIAAVLMVIAVASTVFAEDQSYKSIRLGFSADYTEAAMGQVNAELNKGTHVTVMSSGIAGMLNADVVLAPVLMAGIRTGYIYNMSASAEYLLDTELVTYNSSLIPMEAGVTANIEVPNVPLSIMVGVSGGYGYAMSTIKNDINILNVSYTQPYTGGNFIGEITGTINYKLSSSLSLNINGGYRLAKILQMVQSENVTYDLLGVPVSAGAKGDVLKDSNGKDLAFDFSGFNLGLGLSLGF